MINRIKKRAALRLQRFVMAVVRDAGFIAEREMQPLWYESNTWEPAVQLALRDLCRPGMVAYDVGANMGGLAVLMSRMVGPSGRVYAFEASRRNLEPCQRHLVRNGCSNTQLYHAAIAERTGDEIAIYLGEHDGADSILPLAGASKSVDRVRTLALDDFVAGGGEAPDMIKMDIEGAEWRALQGMTALLEKARPHLILEHVLNVDGFDRALSDACLAYLVGLGYVAIDLSTYRRLATFDGYPDGLGITNVLYVAPVKLSETGYSAEPTQIEVCSLESADFAASGGGSGSAPIALKAGRYVAEVELEITAPSAHVRCGVESGGKVLMSYSASAGLIERAYRFWPFHVKYSCDAQLFIGWDGADPAPVRMMGATIRRIEMPLPQPNFWLA